MDIPEDQPSYPAARRIEETTVDVLIIFRELFLGSDKAVEQKGDF